MDACEMSRAALLVRPSYAFQECIHVFAECTFIVLSPLFEWLRGSVSNNKTIHEQHRVPNTRSRYDNCGDVRVGVIDDCRCDEHCHDNGSHTNGAMNRIVAQLNVSFEHLLVFTIKQSDSFCRDVEMVELFVLHEKA